jgi:prepilin-type N-terminal cleavage/methylation domain-containing protein
MYRMKKTPWLCAAFTLIELLTVIAIIAVLMGLLFPALNIAKEGARKAQASTDVRSIVSAIKGFQTEYGRYPQPSTNTSDTIISPAKPNANNSIMNILRCTGTGSEVNTRQIVYIEPRMAKGNTNVGGIGTDGVFFDPWGMAYGIAMDTNYDGGIKTSDGLQYTSITTGTLSYGAVAWSFGKDAQPGTKGDKKLEGSDDIVSWQ